MITNKSTRTYCSNKTCVVRTCSRNICHHNRRYYRNTNWIRLGPDTCELYKGFERYASIFERDTNSGANSTDIHLLGIEEDEGSDELEG